MSVNQLLTGQFTDDEEEPLHSNFRRMLQLLPVFVKTFKHEPRMRDAEDANHFAELVSSHELTQGATKEDEVMIKNYAMIFQCSLCPVVNISIPSQPASCTFTTLCNSGLTIKPPI